MRPLALNSHLTRTYHIRNKTNKLVPCRGPRVTSIWTRTTSIVTLGTKAWVVARSPVQRKVTSLPSRPSFCFHHSSHPRTFAVVILSAWNILPDFHMDTPPQSQRPSLSHALACSQGHPIFISFIDCCMTFSTSDVQRNGFFLGQGIGIWVPNYSLSILLSIKR